ncbi:MAG: immunoglobulin domain-containing protein [Verrucomicrobia bacterium]|nr:immunoglobulin domain-containing protein [Verrucomicrobiota bacterium]
MGFQPDLDLLRATSGTATLVVLGGLRTAPASGLGSSDPSTNADFALQLTGFPKQGTGARTAGLEITTSTIGFQSVVLRFDVRATSTASRRLQVLYSTDGQTLKAGPAFTLNGGATFTNGLTVDFSAIPDIANQPEFRVRLVSDWDGDSYVGAAGNYSTVGTWRIDHLRLTGVSSGVQPGDSESENSALFTISSQPMSLQVPDGGGALFRVAAKGAGPLGYQWFLNGQLLSGATRQELRIAQVSPDHLGLYTVRVSHAEDSLLSGEASLSFLTDPTIRPVRVEAVPGPQGSLRLAWSTRPGSIYSVLRSEGWAGLTTVIATGVTGGSLIETPPAGDQFFYWVQVQ